MYISKYLEVFHDDVGVRRVLQHLHQLDNVRVALAPPQQFNLPAKRQTGG